MPVPSSAGRVNLRAVAAVLSLATTGCAGALSPQGDAATPVFWLTLGLTVVGGVVYAAVVVIALHALRGRRDGDDPGAGQVTRRYIIGLAIIMPVAVLSLVIVSNVSTLLALPRDGDLVIEVDGNQYWWEVTYPDAGIVTANEVHIPTGRDVLLELTSQDVIHSFWIPQLAGKRDMIPGQVNELTISADEPGRYVGACAEFCGIQHANMRLVVVAHDTDAFDEWITRWSDPAGRDLSASAARGREAFETYSCASCHAIAGTPYDGQLGPALTDLFTRRTIGAGTIELTREHLARWVTDAQSVKPGVEMPPLDIPDDDLADLLDYLETLQP